MIELIIIADDLTGAIETGVQLSTNGIPTKVMYRPESLHQDTLTNDKTSVLVINTESRHIEAEEAVKRISELIRKAKAGRVRYFYKKTDSTMRGNIGAELEAFMNALALQTLAFVPAHPKLKRFTQKGFHYLDQQLLHETSFGLDPLEPIKTSNVRDLLSQQTENHIENVDISMVSKLLAKKGILVFDCESLPDLRKIGKILNENEMLNASSGSAAMAEFLPELLKLKPSKIDIPKLQGPILIVNGSLNPISREQVNYAASKGIKVKSIPEEFISNSDFLHSHEIKLFLSDIQDSLSAGENIILNSSPLNIDEANQLSRTKNPEVNEYELVSKRIGLLVAEIKKEFDLKSMAIFGGDTLMGIMRALACKHILPKTEIISGVALSLAKLKNEDLLLVSKPGGYGDKEVILHILDFIYKTK